MNKNRNGSNIIKSHLSIFIYVGPGCGEADAPELAPPSPQAIRLDANIIMINMLKYFVFI